MCENHDSGKGETVCGLDQPEIREIVEQIIAGLGLENEEADLFKQVGNQLYGRRPIDQFIASLKDKSDLPEANLLAFYLSPVGMGLRRLGTIEWFCEEGPDGSGQDRDRIRPLFQGILNNDEYQHYRQWGMSFIRAKFGDFMDGLSTGY